MQACGSSFETGPVRRRITGALCAVNNGLVSPQDSALLVSSIDQILTQRPQTRLVDASADLASTVQRVSDALMHHPEQPFGI